ncbi:uncharacterized protein AruCF_0958 [Achromobacter ruhlandii]|nr:uncharacterized protein AruCF_0958 [Achromobacter ruhlandii]
MAVKNTPQRIARHSGVKIPACRFALAGCPVGVSPGQDRADKKDWRVPAP